LMSAHPVVDSPRARLHRVRRGKCSPSCFNDARRTSGKDENPVANLPQAAE
jgi:hypothetical protein